MTLDERKDIADAGMEMMEDLATLRAKAVQNVEPKKLLYLSEGIATQSANLHQVLKSLANPQPEPRMPGDFPQRCPPAKLGQMF